MIKKIPNLISLARLLMIPVVFWCVLVDLYLFATLFIIAIAISDLLDGFLARYLNAETELGSYLDAVADKAFVISIFTLIGVLDLLPIFLIIVVISRDILIIGYFAIASLTNEEITFKPLFISKFNTFFVFILIIVTFADNLAEVNLQAIKYYLTPIVMLTTLFSLLSYIKLWLYKEEIK